MHETSPDGILVVDARDTVVSHKRPLRWEIAPSQLHE